MRSFTLVVLLAVALAIVSFAPTASASANITLYADMQCTQVMGEGMQTIPLPSSYSCQDMSGPTQSGSGKFWCLNSGGMNNFSLSAWMSVSDCSGDADVTINSVGKQDSCVVMNIMAGGTTIPAFAQVSCGSDWGEQQEGDKPFQVADLAHTISTAKRAAFMQARGGRHGMLSRMAMPQPRMQQAP